MKKLLITGFEPFGGECVNPSWEAVQQLDGQIGAWQLTKLRIPTVFGAAAQAVLDAVEAQRPDAVICVGQAGGRSGITPEVVAINLREASIPDNAGRQPVNEPVVPGGPAAYFSTLPVREMVDAVKAAGLPCALSYSAGAFVCNDVLYTLLHRLSGSGIPAGFIHVPYLPEQAKEGVPSLPLDGIRRALAIAIETLP